MSLADSFRRFRQDFNLTQKQVAESIGIAETAYQKYEHGKAVPSVEVVARIADAYGVSLDYLVGRSTLPYLHVFADSPKVTDTDFLDKLIFDTRIDHAERLAQAGGKVDEPAIEYADLLLRHYHRAFLTKLIAAGVKL